MAMVSKMKANGETQIETYWNVQVGGDEDLKGSGDGKEKPNLTDMLEEDYFRLLLTGCSGDNTENKGLK